MNILQVRGEQKRKSTRATADSKAMRIFKRAAAGVAVLSILAGSLFLIFGTRQEQVTLNVYNWGMNIADGSDDTLDIIAAFEEKYPYIDVNYSTYESNEAL